MSHGSISQNGTSACPCCGSRSGTKFTPVLWQALVDEWKISDEEREYIDHQQGESCVRCGANLRSQALALAILQTLRHRGPFCDFAASIRGRLLRILEINPAGDLTRFFRHKSRHELRSYPEIDMTNMEAIPTGSYDLVIHSDTLEHVPDPEKGLAECCRILRPGGACCFTVPIIIGRLSRNRRGLPPSHHGFPGESRNDWLVHTEYGADAWFQVLQAGFAECHITSLNAPSAFALTGIKSL